MKGKKIVKYMHTLNGIPAEYYDGEQVRYASRNRITKLAQSLKQIKSEQKKSNIWRIKQGFNPVENYGYVRLTIDV